MWQDAAWPGAGRASGQDLLPVADFSKGWASSHPGWLALLSCCGHDERLCHSPRHHRSWEHEYETISASKSQSALVDAREQQTHCHGREGNGDPVVTCEE